MKRNECETTSFEKLFRQEERDGAVSHINRFEVDNRLVMAAQRSVHISELC